MPNAQGVGLEEALLLTFTQSTPALVGLAHSHCAFKTAVDLLKPVAGVIGLIACPRGGSKHYFRHSNSITRAAFVVKNERSISLVS